MNKYKSGDKFVIEIEDVYEQGNPTLYRIKGFNSLVFDARGLDKLGQLVTGVDTHSYNMGMEAAWELCRRIGEPKAPSEIKSMFEFMGVEDFYDILKTLTVHKAEEIFEEWENLPLPKLTEREKGFVECVNGGYIVRDRTSRVWWFYVKPYKEFDEWKTTGLKTFIDPMCFPFITWEDEEPWSVEELRKLEVQE